MSEVLRSYIEAELETGEILAPAAAAAKLASIAKKSGSLVEASRRAREADRMARRDADIIARVKAREPYRDIAKDHGITVSGVSRIWSRSRD